MKTRKINYDSINLSGESNLNIDDAKDLFTKIDWNDDSSFYTLLFEHSFLQFLTINPNEITVEIMLNEDDLLIATKRVSIQEGLELIEYYFENDTVGDISTFEQTHL